MEINLQKKLLLSLISIICTSTAVASNDPFSGFYGSLDAGWTNAVVEMDRVSTVQFDFFVGIPLEQKIVNPFSTNEAANSFTGGVALGYGRTIKNTIYLGLEGRADFQDLTMGYNKMFMTPIENNSSVIGQVASIELKNDYALLLKFGVLLDPRVLLYGLAGSAWGNVIKETTHFHFAQDLLFGPPGSPPFIASGNVSGSDSGYESGRLVGAGMEYLVSQHISLSLEYTHADYGDLDYPSVLSAPMTIQNPLTTAPQFGTVTDNNDFSLTTNNVTLRLTYYLS